MKILLQQFENLIKRMRYNSNWYDFYLVYFGLKKEALIKFKNTIAVKIKMDNISPYYFVEKFYNITKTRILLKSLPQNFECNDFIFNFDNLKWYIKNEYILDSVNDILQRYNEPLTYNLFNSLIGDVFVNVGSNVGGYTLRARKFSDVIAIEPNPQIYNILKKNVELNKINIKILNIAAWDKKCKIKLYEPKTNKLGSVGGVSTLLPDTMLKNKVNYNSFYKVHADTLDNILNDLIYIDLLIIDAENAESVILNHSKKTLAKTKVIIIEVRNNTEIIVREILKNNGFKISVLDIFQGSKNICGKKYEN